MNIQTERLEDHTARLTVEIELERLDKAKQAAARQIAQRVNIPGFRKGKAPYRLLAQYVGEANILSDAVEDLSQEVYREIITQAEIEPYGPGSWDDFKLEPAPTFVYTVPLQPTITLGDYRSVRIDYEMPPVEDSAVDKAMKRLQEQEALVEESGQPVAIGNRVTIDLHSHFADDAPEAEAEGAAEQESDADSKDTSAPAKGAEFIHEHDAQLTLDPEDEPVLPGFNAALVGATVGQEVEFELTVPDGDSDYKDIHGRKIEFHATVKKIEVVTLPALNDELAARITKDEPEPLTLLQLRVRMRKNLDEAQERQYKSDYANRILDRMIEQAAISFPEAMVSEQVDSMVEDLNMRFRQQGMTLDTFVKVSGKTVDEIKADYHDPAVESIRRALVLREFIQAEKVDVSDDLINQRIDEMVAQFGEQSAQFRSIFDTPAMRANIKNDLLQQSAFDRMTALGRGEAIAIAPDPETQLEPESNETTV